MVLKQSQEITLNGFIMNQSELEEIVRRLKASRPKFSQPVQRIQDGR